MTAGKVDLAELDRMLMELRAEAKALGIARATADRIDALGPVITTVHTARAINDARRIKEAAGSVDSSPGGSP